MKYLLMFFVFVSISFSPQNSSIPASYSVTVNITNIRNSKGRIQLQIYKNQETFAKETPWKSFYVYKTGMKNKTVTYVIPNIEAGTYGIALLDDENQNKEMDFSMLVPKEGFGFSDYFHTSWSRPVFSDFKFQLASNKTVTMKVKY